MAEPTAFEQFILELTNRARMDPAAEAARLGIDLNEGLAPGTISASAKAPLAMNPLLVDAARGHSRWILDADTFSHEGAGGSSPGDRMVAAGYPFGGVWSWGENIAMRAGMIEAEKVVALHDQLFLSADHRENTLRGEFREVGMGLAEGDYDYGAPYGVWSSVAVAQNFAQSGSGSFLLGVAYDDADGDRFYDPGEGLGGLKVSIRNMATGGSRSLETWSAGGWQTKVSAGDYEVTFSGPGLAAPIARSVSVGSANRKLDLEPGSPPAGGQTVAGGAAAETLSGGDGADRLSGGDGKDRMFGGTAADTVSGEAGADTLIGGSGQDRLEGGDGEDRLIGGPNHDLLWGGAGADRFVFLALSERGDRIGDFRPEEGDRLEIGRLVPDAAGASYEDLAAGGFARLVDGSGGAVLSVDADGGGDEWLTLAILAGRTAASLGTEILIA